jgi:hypothetical protein
MKSLLRLKRTQAIVALVMAIAILATLVGLGLNAGIARAASPNGIGAQKVPLTTTNRNCDGTVATPQGNGGGTGFAIINKAASGKLISNVVLENAVPNATYHIRLIQILPNGVDCQLFNGPGEATLTTDALGNGNANYQEAVIDGANDTFVAINNAADPGDDFYTTQVVNP